MQHQQHQYHHHHHHHHHHYEFHLPRLEIPSNIKFFKYHHQTLICSREKLLKHTFTNQSHQSTLHYHGWIGTCLSCTSLRALPYRTQRRADRNCARFVDFKPIFSPLWNPWTGPRPSDGALELMRQTTESDLPGAVSDDVDAVVIRRLQAEIFASYRALSRPSPANGSTQNRSDAQQNWAERGTSVRDRGLVTHPRPDQSSVAIPEHVVRDASMLLHAFLKDLIVMRPR